MKLFKSLIIILFLAVQFNVSAQDEYSDEESINDGIYKIAIGSLDWDEYYEKEKTAGIVDTVLHIECKKKEIAALAVAHFPLDPKKNFTLEAEIMASSIDDKHYFGLVFNYADDDNYDLGLFRENEFQYVKVVDGEWKISGDKKKKDKSKGKNNQVRLKLKKGKNKLVSVKLQQKGNKVEFSVNGDENFFSRRNLDIATSDFGFYTDNKSWIDIKSITITQILNEEDLE